MFQRIVVALDGSSTAERALPHAAALAGALGARLVLLRVIEAGARREGQPPDPIEWEALRAEAPAYLATVAARLSGDGIDADTATAEGQPVDEIVDYARAEPHTLLVLCSHGHGGAGPWVLGGVAQKSALHAHVSLLVVRAHGGAATSPRDFRYERVMVPLDGSSRAECVLPLIGPLARAQGCGVLLVSIVEGLEPCAGLAANDSRRAVLRELDAERLSALQSYLEATAARLTGEGTAVRTRVVTGGSPDVLLHRIAAEERADLVVLAAHGGACAARRAAGALPLHFLVFGETPLLVVQDLSPDEIALAPGERAAREVWGH